MDEELKTDQRSSLSPWLDSSGPEGVALREALLGFEWRRLELTLVNQHNKAAREPPMSVCRSILYHAWRKGGLDPQMRTFVFHPRSLPLAERVRKGARYELEVLFPTPEPDLADAFVEGLHTHLAAPSANFVLEINPQSHPASLASLETKVLPRLDPEAGELCLDFLTPLRWNWKGDPENKAHNLNWRLSAPEFLDLLRRRLLALVAPEDRPPFEPIMEAALARAQSDGLALLPYYWDFRRHSHSPKTPRTRGGSQREDWLGMEGPLYIRGAWHPLLSALLLLSAWHVGQKADQPQGRFLLRTGRTFFDRLLPNPAHYREIDDEMREEDSGTGDLWCGVEERESAIAELAARVAAGEYQPAAAKLFGVPKNSSSRASGGEREERILAELEPVDSLVHKVVARILQRPIDRMLEDASHAWRPGRGVETARRLAAEQVRAGYPLVLESDIESFFDEIPWDRLETVLDRHLPESDQTTRTLLARIIRQSAARDGREITREKGLLQGSPLSPLLANLFLDPFDEAMMALGHPLVRYGDDLILFARDGAESRQLLEDCRATLADLGLSLRKDKTLLTPVEAGFRFLGLNLGRDLGEEFVERSSLRKALFVDRPGCFLGVDGDSLVQKQSGKLVGRLPLARIGEILTLGPVAISSALVAACSRRGIAVTLASPNGYGVVAVAPAGPAHHAVGGRHWTRHAALDSDDRIGLAALMVEAKIHNHLAWFDDLSLVPDAVELRRDLRGLLASLPTAVDIDAVRGIEGRAARLVFTAVRDLIRAEGFATAGRVPREKPDPWNSLLDFASFLLFTRINHLLRSRGLNPYLGFLHSPENRYESLVCDLQEPFRPRLERLVLRIVNHRILTANDFTLSGDGRWSLRGAGAAHVFEAFEKEMQTRRTRDPGTWRQIIVAQVDAVRDWVEQPDSPLRVYRMGGRRGRGTEDS